MRVLFLNYEYPPLGGGAANATEYLLKEYALTEDIEVDLITSSPTDDFSLLHLSDRIRIHLLPIGKSSHNLHHQSQKDLLVYSFKAYQYAKKLLQEGSYDVIHAFFGVPCGVLAWRLGKKRHIPYIVSLRGSDVPGYSERFAFLYTFLRLPIRLVWQKAFRVVSNSRGLKELALQSSPLQAIDIIPNGVDTRRFFPDVDKVPDDEWIITAGATRLTARKGLHLIIEALPQLIHPTKKVIFEVMGDGASEEALKQKAKKLGVADRVRFLGRISANETYQYYQRASVFILPSANEGMSNALLEALASGLPALVTDTGGSSELVKEGENGIIMERTTEAIIDALRFLLTHENERVVMGEKSRTRALEQSWASVAHQYQVLYQASQEKRI